MAEALLSLCAWLALAWGTLTLPTTAGGEAANVAIAGDVAYASLGAGGVEIVRLPDGERRVMALPPTASADDLAVADGLLFVLDARPPGSLAVYSLADPLAPALRESPLPVEVGPFSGVSAAAGRVAVSGGTGRLSLREYARDGRLGDEIATVDLGRGQPDVLLSPDGRRALVSVHVVGPRFALGVAELGSAPLRVAPAGSVPLDTVGFTPGGARPASFPVQSAALPGGVVLVAHAAGLGVVDAADPAAPRLLRVLDLGVRPVAVDARDGLVAVVGSDPEPRLVVLDVRDPARPEILATRALPAGSLATGVAIGPAQVVVAAHARGVLVFAREGLAGTR
jgi:hypothetical protein